MKITYQDKTFKLTKETYTIGRGSDQDIKIPSPQVSRSHCTVQWVEEDKAYIIADWSPFTDSSSKNGVWIDGQRVKSYILKEKCLIGLSPEIILIFDPEKENAEIDPHATIPAEA